jgi:hypothetical protein
MPAFIPGLRSPDGLRIEWRPRGTFLAGSASPGQRTLVYDGPIQRASLHEAFDVSLYLDARYLDRGLRFDPTFEIDVAP